MLLGMKEAPPELTRLMELLGFAQIEQDMDEGGIIWAMQLDTETDFTICISPYDTYSLKNLARIIYHQGRAHGQSEVRRDIKRVIGIRELEL